MHQYRPLYALLLRLGSVFGFSLMTAFIKWAGENGVALPQLVFWRHAFTVLIVLSIMTITRNFSQLRTERAASHAKRALIGTFGISLTFGSLLLLPLPEATALSFSSPLFAVLATAFILREPVGPWRWAAVLLGIGGILIITRPEGTSLPLVGVAAALGSSMILVLMNFIVRGLGRTESPVTITFYAALFGATIASVGLPFTSLPHGPQQWLLLMAASLAGALGQMLMAQSLRYGHVSSVIVMEYSSLIWAALFGWLAWDHLPPAATWMGAPLIVVAGLIVAWREHRQAQEKTQASA